MNNAILNAFTDLNREEVLNAIKAGLDDGNDPAELLSTCREGVERVIERYERRECYLDSLCDASAISKAARELINQKLPKDKRRYLGKIVICTVADDVHQNGRIMTADLLAAVGFEVFDLGNETPPEKVVDEIKRTCSSILALSGLVSSCVEPMKETVQAVRAAGLNPKVLIGGGMAGEDLVKYTDADAYAKDMAESVRICCSFV